MSEIEITPCPRMQNSWLVTVRGRVIRTHAKTDAQVIRSAERYRVRSDAELDTLAAESAADDKRAMRARVALGRRAKFRVV